ncbi:class I SAM-dependent methyltransferase [Effusibacillus dendaii]|uniref:Methylase n=1 Tax=Effusibacillus dendaii TaxID=2743772 RepID=A0A7I8DEJ2_9BACL|nr:class I SAM-dependent methyltransferase [Effusibacillus dendaii]BCJ86331.1 hypothetical protein skT53_13160 [Effusibacillus dendaii]
MAKLESNDVYEQDGVAMTSRSFREYQSMFALQENVLKSGPILDVAAGASSFTAEANLLGLQSYAVDPLYHLTAEQMHQHGRKEIEESTAKLEKIAHRYDWSFYGDLATHRQNREDSLERFISDYKTGRGSRYKIGSLPRLPFAGNSFSLVLCNHFLFLYQEQFDYDFHLQSVRELIRVCRTGGEVRIYPLVTLRREPYLHLQRLIDEIRKAGQRVEQIPIDFQFAPDANRFLQIRKEA